MAKNTQPEVQEEQKVQTKYDKKMEERRKRREKDKKQEKLSKIIGSIVVVLLLAVIAVSIIIPVVNKNNAISKTYVKVGNHEITKLEYDYYYNSSVNSYLSNYAQVLPYLGLDTTVDFDKQSYSEDMTWKDYFDEMAVGQISQVKAMVDDANAKGFVCDPTAEYESFVKSIADTAASSVIDVNDYYKTNFGTYATQENMAPFIKENMIAGAYFDDLLAKNEPSAEEVEAYYQENKKNYDKVDFRNFPVVSKEFTVESTEEEKTVIMSELKAKADAMLAARQAGADFEELCLENATEDAKANYEDPETEYSFNEGVKYSGTATIIGDWLFADERKDNEVAVLEDTTGGRYFVVEFMKRYYDEADNAMIADTIADEKATEYMSSLSSAYSVVYP